MWASRLEYIGSWEEQEELLKKLEELGADVHFWDGESAPAKPTPDRLIKAAELWNRHMAEGNFEKADEAAMAAGTPWVWENVLSAVDSHFVGMCLPKGAVSLYASAIDEAPRPSVQAELGYLLLRRAGVDPLPLSEFDFVDPEPDFDECLLEGPIFAAQERPKAIRLALDAYARVYGYNYYWIGVEDPEGIVHPWLQLLALDGLRVIFLEDDRLHEAELTCRVYEAWTQVLGPDFYADPDAWRFQQHFVDTLKQTLLANRQNRQTVGKSLAREFGDARNDLPSLTLTYLINGDILFQNLERKGDFASAVNEYSKAVEAALQDALGRYGDRSPSEPFPVALRQAVDEVRKRRTQHLSRISLSTFKNALSIVSSDAMKKALFSGWIRKTTPGADESWADQMVIQLKALVPPRSRSDHAVQPGQPWKVSLEEAERVRDICLGADQPGLLRRLACIRAGLRGNKT